jgi:hypothetical protein
MDASDSRLSSDADGIAQAVVRYLEAHPYAADTVEGITRWWLGPGLGNAPPDALEQALETLVASRHVVRDSLGDGRFVYRRGPSIGTDNGRET